MFPLSMPARTMPTAIPSGILCSVTASISIRFFPIAEGRPSGRAEFVCRCGIRLSNSSMNPMPIRKPTTGSHAAVLPAASAMSIDGISSDHTEAAIITPAAKPRRRF